jgi:hypothetical protein
MGPMHRPPLRRLAVLLGTAALAVPALAHGQAAPPEPTGPDFEAILTADAKAVKDALADDRAFAAPAAFGDLTGDGTSDAVVLVSTPGASGAIAAYVLSALGTDDGELRVVYRSQSLYRAFVRASRGALIVLTPSYARGDDVCCPTVRLERTYVYDRRAKVFRRTASRRLTRTAR